MGRPHGHCPGLRLGPRGWIRAPKTTAWLPAATESPGWTWGEDPKFSTRLFERLITGLGAARSGHL